MAAERIPNPWDRVRFSALLLWGHMVGGRWAYDFWTRPLRGSIPLDSTNFGV